MARTPIDRQVLLLSRVVAAHQQANRLRTLGNVKAEKIVYLIEAHAGIDLDRAPMREAAGPADFPRLKKAAHRAAMLHAFSVRGGFGGRGGVWSPDSGLRKRVGEYEELFAERRQEIERIIDLLVPMDSERAEIIATLYACWNDLLARGAQPEDQAIIEDCHGWAEGKQRFDGGRLAKALGWMRDNGLVPTGRAAPTTIRSNGPQTKKQSERKRRSQDDDVYAIVLDLLGEQDVITSGDAQHATGLDAAGVRPYLSRLVQEGHAVTEGRRRGMKYRRARD